MDIDVSVGAQGLEGHRVHELQPAVVAASLFQKA